MCNIRPFDEKFGKMVLLQPVLWRNHVYDIVSSCYQYTVYYASYLTPTKELTLYLGLLTPVFVAASDKLWGEKNWVRGYKKTVNNNDMTTIVKTTMHNMIILPIPNQNH